MRDPSRHTEPTQGEVDRLVCPLDLPATWAAATAPTDAEVARVAARPRPDRSATAWGMLVPLLALAAGILVAVGTRPAPSTLSVPEGQVFDVVDAQKLDAAWSVVGRARVRVARSGRGGLEVELDRGTLAFTGIGGGVTVRAREASFAADEGHFLVAVRPDRIELEVLSGAVAVLAPEVREVAAGQRWAWPPPLGSGRWLPPFGSVPGGAPATPSAMARPRTDASPPPGRVHAPPALPEAGAAARVVAILARREAGDSAATLVPLVDAWLGEFPTSPLAPEMRWLELELAVDTTAPALAIDVVDRWTAAHPDDPRRVDAWWLRAEIAENRLHDCATAGAAYRWLVANAPPADGFEARRRLAACLAP